MRDLAQTLLQHLNPLNQFIRMVEGDPALQAEIGQAEQPAQIVALAERHGAVVSVEALRAVSRDLSAPYWPWAGQGHAWRRRFFGQA
jgi:hypothetical protein